MFVARHLQTLIEAGDDPPTADLDPDADAVAVLTVHKAKGLEFPVVFMPGLVAGRFPTHAPARAARRSRSSLVGETLPEGDFQLQEERRLFYVGMTRARDELVLTPRRRLRRRHRPAALAVRARGARPAADGGRAGAGVTAATGLERIAAAQPVTTEAAPVRSARRRAARC